MNDIEYTFRQDAAEKKSTAQSARRRVSGAKSHRCTLPSDSLTEAQRKKLNGPMRSYDLSKPMRYAAFKCLPRDLAEQYLNGLINRFEVSMSSVATIVLETSQSALWRYCEKKGIKALRRPGRDQEYAKEALRTWVARHSEDSAPEEVSEPMNDDPLMTAASADTAGSDKVIMNQISMLMRVSNGDPQDMFQLIRALLGGRDAELEININFI